jgi:hypothetical protein
MRSASIAEWIVRRCTSQKRAAAIVGDLLELKPQKGNRWFWFSLTRVVISLGWRRPLAFVTAFSFGAWACSGLTATASMGIRAQLSHQIPWMNLSFVFVYILWFVWVYAVIRYGLQDRVAHLALALAGPITAITCFGRVPAVLFILVYAAIRYGLSDHRAHPAVALTVAGVVTAIIYYGRQPLILVTCVALSVGVVAASILSREGRRATRVLFAVEAAAFGVGLAAMYLANSYLNFIVPMPRESLDLQAHPSIRWMYLGMIFATVWMMATVCSRMHAWMMLDRSIDLEDGSTSPS